MHSETFYDDVLQDWGTLAYTICKFKESIDAGVVGPYMIGALKAKFQGYTIPMLFMTCVNSLAVVYFAILLPFLPAKTGRPQAPGALLMQLKLCRSPQRS